MMPRMRASASLPDRTDLGRTTERMRPRVQKRIDRWSDRVALNPFKGAWWVIASVTVGVTILGGLLIRVTDPDSIPSVESGFWWSLQTVTTVGYGDVVPASVPGRLTATARFSTPCGGR